MIVLPGDATLLKIQPHPKSLSTMFYATGSEFFSNSTPFYVAFFGIKGDGLFPLSMLERGLGVRSLMHRF
jgi:hypothetical protein